MAQYLHNINHQALQLEGKPWTQITQPIEIETREGIESVVDTFSFKIADKCVPKGISFTDQDNIQIGFGSKTTPTDVDFDGLITSLEMNYTDKGKTWALKATTGLNISWAIKVQLL